MENAKKYTCEKDYEKFFDNLPDKSLVIYWFDPQKKVVIQGFSVLSNKEHNQYISDLIYIGPQNTYDSLTALGIDEFYVGVSGGSVACVGKDSKTNAWFGWTHRGHGKFEVGYVVKEGCYLSNYVASGYSPKTEQQCQVLAMIFAEILD